jgi:hypothetical protein
LNAGYAAVIALVACAACSSKLPDPPPAAQSQELPQAPPGARGARAATLNAPALPTAPLWDEPEDLAPEQPPSSEGGAPSETEGDGGGVAL